MDPEYLSDSELVKEMRSSASAIIDGGPDGDLPSLATAVRLVELLEEFDNRGYLDIER